MPEEDEEYSEDKKTNIKSQIKSILVKDLMCTDVVAIDSNNTLDAIYEILIEKDISNVPVMEFGKLVGVVGKIEILNAAAKSNIDDVTDAQVEKLRNVKVRNIMRKPNVIYAESTIKQSSDMMERLKTNMLIVIDNDGNVIGIISKIDLFRGASRVITKKKIETAIDEVLEIIRKKGSVTIEEISEKFHVSRQTVEEWGKILEEHKLVTIEYPVIGKPYLVLAKDVEE